MSYYITFQEIPFDLLETLLSRPTDSKLHEKIMDQFFHESEAKSGLNYRSLTNGKDSGVSSPSSQTELKFFEALRSDPEWHNFSKFDLILRHGYPGIQGHRHPQQLKECWSVIERILKKYPELAPEDMSEPENEFDIGDGPSSLANSIRYYYGCAHRGSADLQIDY